MSWFSCLFPWCARSWRAVEVEAEGDLFRDTCCDARRSSGRRGCGPVTTGRGPLEFCAESGFDSGGMLFGSCGEVGDTGLSTLYPRSLALGTHLQLFGAFAAALWMSTCREARNAQIQVLANSEIRPTRCARNRLLVIGLALTSADRAAWEFAAREEMAATW